MELGKYQQDPEKSVDLLSKIEEYLNDSLLRDDKLTWEQIQDHNLKGSFEPDDFMSDGENAEEETKEIVSKSTGLKRQEFKTEE